ncbi:MAG: TlyA family RNA methyltransferase [Bifidobacteriaceae bacterium]|nr:TlyA family RNA methyltransferase [Bifidobacteriaceae bacterium]
MSAERLDVRVAKNSVAGTRTKAARLIRAGLVRVNGSVVAKPSHAVAKNDYIEIAAIPAQSAFRYVSRGAVKLLGAFDTFGPQGLALPTGRVCWDIGASTGGFTQVLLEKGASRVMALDVGHDQLSPLLRSDPRTVDLSGWNVRDVQPSDLPERPDYIVSDVSFISLRYVIPVIARVLRQEQQARTAVDAGDDMSLSSGVSPVEIVLLIKPQFEVGKGKLSKNGIVTDPVLRQMVVDAVICCARSNGFSVEGCIPSPIRGTYGNREYLLWLRPKSARDQESGQTQDRALL